MFYSVSQECLWIPVSKLEFPLLGFEFKCRIHRSTLEILYEEALLSDVPGLDFLRTTGSQLIQTH